MTKREYTEQEVEELINGAVLSTWKVFDKELQIAKEKLNRKIKL